MTTAALSAVSPTALVSSLVLDDGRRWGEVAEAFQVADVGAVLSLDPLAPRLHFQTRPRGGSKTLDAAGACLVAMLTQAPARSTSHAFARDADQAARLLDALVGLAQRSGLAALLDIGTWAVSVKATGARLVIETADAASAFGALPFLVIADELAAWPTTRSARTLWEAVISGLPKRRDSRLLCITSAGDPAHWSHSVLEAARSSPRWRVSETLGPVPWLDTDDLEEQRRLLPASSFARLHLNRWTAAEDRLVSPDDLRACVTLDGPVPPRRGRSYVVGLDLGLKDDATVLSVCHAESTPELGPPRVVLDRQLVFQGTRSRPVDLSVVEAALLQLAREFPSSRIRFDPWQAVGLAQRLRAQGIRAEEWTFSATSVGRLATNLHVMLREHRLALPDDPALLAELANVRLRETAPGVLRLDHDSGQHDDRAVSLGLAALALTERRATGGYGRITMPATTRPVVRTLHDTTAKDREAVMARRLLATGVRTPNTVQRRRELTDAPGLTNGVTNGAIWARIKRHETALSENETTSD